LIFRRALHYATPRHAAAIFGFLSAFTAHCRHFRRHYAAIADYFRHYAIATLPLIDAIEITTLSSLMPPRYAIDTPGCRH